MPSDSINVTKLGAAIRQVREAHGLTIEALALAAGMHTSHLSKVERAKRSIGFEKLCDLDGALPGTSLSELIALAETLDCEP